MGIPEGNAFGVRSCSFSWRQMTSFLGANESIHDLITLPAVLKKGAKNRISRTGALPHSDLSWGMSGSSKEWMRERGTFFGGLPNHEVAVRAFRISSETGSLGISFSEIPQTIRARVE